MHARRITAELFGVAWVIVVIALVGGVAMWSMSVSGSIGAAKVVTPLPSPTPVVAVPTVITIYPNSKPAEITQSGMCAEVAPKYNSVIVETSDGSIVANIRC
jgi:hypothetical protein